MIVNYRSGVTIWKGKNVKNDYLDLHVPMHDVGGALSHNCQFANILTHSNQMRVYDVRGTHKRPVKEM